MKFTVFALLSLLLVAFAANVSAKALSFDSVEGLHDIKLTDENLPSDDSAAEVPESSENQEPSSLDDPKTANEPESDASPSSSEEPPQPAEHPHNHPPSYPSREHKILALQKYFKYLFKALGEYTALVIGEISKDDDAHGHFPEHHPVNDNTPNIESPSDD